MIKEYKALLKEVECVVFPLGFSVIKNNDFEVVFSNADNWVISFQGERYVRGAFELFVGVNGYSFSVRILMMVFNVFEKPSLKNQLKFISDEKENIFILPPPYAELYDVLNDVDE